ncbi:MAG: efflux RND transporter periplasmic adaptor subunit [Anderseniella sp.]|nr:efflux RND transporter periplasmic adaptor subunit [Anderseniella sp.]
MSQINFGVTHTCYYLHAKLVLRNIRKVNNSTTEPDSETVEEVLGLGTKAMPWWRSWRVLGLTMLVIFAAGLGYTYWSGSNASNITQYKSEPVSRGGLTVTVSATGTVEPTNEVEISSELSGMIKSVKVDYNDEVKLGQVLAELDTDKLEAQVAHTRATLTAKQAKLLELKATQIEKKSEYERVKPLARKGYSSQSDLDVAKAAYDRAVALVASGAADVAVAEADLNLDETNLKKACICSPINGVVLNRNIDPGQTVASSFQAPVLFTLADDLREMQLEVDVDEADIGKVKEGNKAKFTVESFQDRDFPAQISELRFAPETVDGVVTYKAILTIDNNDLLLRPGMTATAEINVQTVEDALLIPNAALRYAPPADTAAGSGKSFVQSILPGPPRSTEIAKIEQTRNGERRIWVLRNDMPVSVNVRTGVTDGSKTQILEGELDLNDRVIVDTIKAAN